MAHSFPTHPTKSETAFLDSGEGEHSLAGHLLTSPNAPVPNWWYRVNSRVGLFWCREFHRRHRHYVEVDEQRLKVHCTQCGRKFIRDRHYGYRVS